MDCDRELAYSTPVKSALYSSSWTVVFENPAEISLRTDWCTGSELGPLIRLEAWCHVDKLPAARTGLNPRSSEDTVSMRRSKENAFLWSGETQRPLCAGFVVCVDMETQEYDPLAQDR